MLSLPLSLSISTSVSLSFSLIHKVTAKAKENQISMAVEARRMNLLPSQFIANRDFMKPNQGGTVDIYNNTQMTTGLPYAAVVKVPDTTALPFYQSSACDWGSGKADSGLTSNFPAATRKRTRRSVYDDPNALAFAIPHQKTKFSGLLDQEIATQIQQQHSEIDRFIALHTEKLRLEMEERKKRQSRMLVSAIEEQVVKRLKEKDEEIERMGKLNWVLQERVRRLCMENQVWRDLAETNEATVNSLRTNLEQVLLANVGEEPATEADEAESCCGSNDYERETEEGGGGSGLCRKCGAGEPKVLLLPCRHLCLCTLCGSTLHTCPVCNSAINASVHVNFS